MERWSKELIKQSFKQSEVMNLLLGWGFSLLNTWRMLEMFSVSNINSFRIAFVLCSIFFSAFALISLKRSTFQKTIGILAVSIGTIISLFCLFSINPTAIKGGLDGINSIVVGIFAAMFFSFVFWYFTFIKYRFIILIGTSTMLFGMGMVQSGVFDFSCFLLLILCTLGWVERTRRKSASKNAINDFSLLKGVFILICTAFIFILILTSFFNLNIPRNAQLDSKINNAFRAMSINTDAGGGGILPKGTELLNPFEFSSQVINEIQQPLDSSIVLEIYGDNPRYLKTQAWSIYNAGKWSAEENDSEGVNLNDTIILRGNRMKAQDENKALQCTIKCIISPKRIIPVPPTVYDLSLEFQSEVYTDVLGEFYLPQGGNEFVQNDNYTVMFYDDTAKFETSQSYNYIEGYNISMLTLPDNLKEKLNALSLQIVKGANNDYEKAVAIENYFRNNDFKYVLNPEHAPNDIDPVEYFLFDSKKGNCTLFASAMVLLARAAGIPAKYDAGFLTVNSDNKNGSIYVRVKDAHAFPELYLTNWGWKVFEPTVSSDSSENSVTNKGLLESSVQNVSIGIRFINKFIYKNLNRINNWFKHKSLLEKAFSILTGFCLIIILMILFAFTKRSLRRKIFAYKFKINDFKLKKPLILYNEALKGLKLLKLEIKEGETPLAYAGRVKDQTSISLFEWVQELNRMLFSESSINSEKLEFFRKQYKAYLTQLRQKVGIGRYLLHRWILGNF